MSRQNNTKTKKTTAAVSLSEDFRRAAATDVEGALAYMIMSAFGVSLSKCASAVSKMIKMKDYKLMSMCIAAGVQVRGNVVFVDMPQISKEYPDLVITGQREAKDQYNFGALHVCGHILAGISNSNICKIVLAKAGSCVTGQGFSDSEASQVNEEIYKSWSDADKQAFAAWAAAVPEADVKIVTFLADGIPKASADFAAKMTKPASAATTAT
jgi:hypothetical protein